MAEYVAIAYDRKNLLVEKLTLLSDISNVANSRRVRKYRLWLADKYPHLAISCNVVAVRKIDLRNYVTKLAPHHYKFNFEYYKEHGPTKKGRAPASAINEPSYECPTCGSQLLDYIPPKK